jgi:hypothetical protein
VIFYVYELCFPGGKVFYVGKGTDNGGRVFKRAHCHCRKNQFVVTAINYLRKKKEKPLVKIVFETESEDAAFDEEARLIAFYGRKIFGGQLWNISDGGRAVGMPIGVPLSEEHKARISAANKGSKRTPEQRERMRLSQLGKKHTQEHINKVIAARLGTRCSEETKRRIADAQRGIPRGPNSPEVRAKKSESAKIAWIKRRQKLSA